jgi:hypothetical protein
VSGFVTLLLTQPAVVVPPPKVTTPVEAFTDLVTADTLPYLIVYVAVGDK